MPSHDGITAASFKYLLNTIAAFHCMAGLSYAFKSNTGIYVSQASLHSLMAASADSPQLVSVVILLAAAVVAVPIFRKLKLGSVLGYLIAGLVIGPFGLGFFSDPQTILHTAELGVVMFLFVIGLEMRPSHLWSLRREIFGLGALQILLCIVCLTFVGKLFGFSWPIAFVGASGFVMTSTAVVMQILGERGELTLPHGQKIVSILLFEDLLIVPLLALIAFLAPASAQAETASQWKTILIGLASLVGLILAGKFLLNPMFRLLASAKAREVMTAAALLVVLGAALLMQLGGLSMAMGAFLAGVLLSESSYRHQIEADIEPFRGILLGLFFLSVGMALDLNIVTQNWKIISAAVVAYMAVKAIGIYIVARLTKSNHYEALERALLMAQGGEFAFVLFSTAATSGLIDAPVNANLTAVVVLSMALTPIVTALADRFIFNKKKNQAESEIDIESKQGSVLLIGFGRFGQVVSQSLLARDFDVTIIDNDSEMIKSASEFGFKIYYGDGTRLDVMRAAGAETARAIAVCVDKQQDANKIVELCTHEFGHAKLLVRAYDRVHALELVNAGVDYQIRETFESAMKFGRKLLEELGTSMDESQDVEDWIRSMDDERFDIEIANNSTAAGREKMYNNTRPLPQPTPFTKPKRASPLIGEETDETRQSTSP